VALKWSNLIPSEGMLALCMEQRTTGPVTLLYLPLDSAFRRNRCNRFPFEGIVSIRDDIAGVFASNRQSENQPKLWLGSKESLSELRNDNRPLSAIEYLQSACNIAQTCHQQRPNSLLTPARKSWNKPPIPPVHRSMPVGSCPLGEIECGNLSLLLS